MNTGGSTARVLSINVGGAIALPAKSGRSGIDKRPVEGPIEITVPEPGRSALPGDTIIDVAHHGGPDQAVYAVAREDLDHFEDVVGRALADGSFGENLTTAGIDVNGAEIGATWAIGSVLLQVTAPRVPCSTFTAWIGHEAWRATFVDARRPGAYLRVLQPGTVRAGDAIEVRSTPGHRVTVAHAFRAWAGERELLVDLVDLDAYPADARDWARAQLARRRDGS